MDSKINPGSFRRLLEPVSCEFEYNRPHGGYAFVKFECQPADELHFMSVAIWPSTDSQQYIERIEADIATTIVDTLFFGACPHIGCNLVLTEIKSHEIHSNPMAFIVATHQALILLKQKDWTSINRR